MTAPAIQHYTPHLLWQLDAELGEGPLWLPEQQRLYFVDLKGGRLHTWQAGASPDAQGTQGTQGTQGSPVTKTWQLPTYLCWLAPCRDPSQHAGAPFIAGLRDGIVRLWLEPELRVEYLHRPLADIDGVRLNDGKADPHGRLWTGSMNANDYSRTDGKLFRMDANGELAVALQDYHICNGPAFSLDGRTMYHNDSYLARTYAYPIGADGALGAPQVWKTLGEGEGAPDGMTVDSEGCLWIAQWGGGRVCRYRPDGALLATVTLPVKQPSSCVLGGPDLKTLFITTAWEHYDAAQRAAEPLAGSLYAVEVDVPGVPPSRFG